VARSTVHTIGEQMRNRAALVAIPVVVVLAILVALAATNIIPIARPTASPNPSITNASPSAGASDAASISPTSLPSQDAQYAACTDFDETVPLALRVEHSLDTGRVWVISVYEDGHVLTPGLTWGDFAGDAGDGAWMLARRLTPGGVAQLGGEVMGTGLFGESGSYYPVPLPNVDPPGRGASGYAITVGSGASAIAVAWTSLFPDDATWYEPSPEREALDVLAARMLLFDTWLPADAWADRDACTVQAERFRVFIDAAPYGGLSEDLPPDIADVPWPLGGEILSWGAEVGFQPPNDSYHVMRCGIAPRADASRLVDQLRNARAGDPFTIPASLDGGPYVQLDLGDRAANRIIQIYIQPLLSDDDQCTIANQPGGAGI
jgi:hypothetical protein